MKRVLGHCLAGATIVVNAVALTSACKHDDSSLFVQDVIYPTPVSVGEACTYTNDPSQTFLPSGALDVAFGHYEYTATYLLGNQLVSQANSQQLQTETSTIDVQGAVVTITDSNGNQLANYTDPTSSTVYPETGSVPGYAVATITVLDEGTVGGIVASKGSLLEKGGTTTLLTYAKFFGETLGGDYVESNNFEFPVTICYGCLITFSSSDDDPTLPGQPNCNGNAAAGGSSASASLPVPCITGQDTSIDCSQCQGVPACRGAYSTMTIPADAGTD
jgi:hypothetical protein